MAAMNNTGLIESGAKIDGQLVRQCISPWIECMVEGVVKEIGDRGCVDVGQPNESPCEVAWTTSRSEHAPKPRVEYGLHGFPAMCIPGGVDRST